MCSAAAVQTDALKFRPSLASALWESMKGQGLLALDLHCLEYYQSHCGQIEQGCSVCAYRERSSNIDDMECGVTESHLHVAYNFSVPHLARMKNNFAAE